MNKPIQITSKITNIKSLLNKFILYKYKNGSLSICYVYKIDGTKLITYNIFNNNYIGKVLYSRLYSFYLKTLNDDIKDCFKRFNPYNVYINI